MERRSMTRIDGSARIWLGAGLAGLMLASATWLSSPAPLGAQGHRGGQPLEKFTLLMPEAHGHTFRTVYVGIEKGWFAEEGLAIDFKVVPGGAVNLIPQLAQGAGDVAWAGGYTVIQARAKGVPIVGLFSASTETLWGLITLRASNIRAPKDLKARTLGVVAYSSATHFMAQGLVRAGGLGEGEVNLKPIGMGGPASLNARQIDGYVWFKTQGLALETRGTPVHVLDLDQFIPVPQDLMLTTEKIARARQGALRAYLRVLKKTSDFEFDPNNWAEGDTYQAKYAPETVLDKAFLSALRKYNHERTERDRARRWRWGSTDPDRLEKAQDFLHEIKVIERKTPVKAMYTNDFLPE
ncbi:MAG: ABC transporter substrate-binding protein [Candidatus Rokuibacteriota bacterium]